ncbi:hypothetical protein MKW98_004202 [Papaver atlanticum]|uniref:Uncharacterized protein n=1 Tax=Papaver atlanticum TaxID=357466 RepID=A0AAD4T652_9MAGN|nr:hypothetical protein MKW98_004202 [Papaver atlanticum]
MEGTYDREPRMEEAIPRERKSYVKKRLPVDLLGYKDMGKCPVAGEPLTMDNLMPVKTNKEWDHAITFCIRTTITYSKARQELSHALYQEQFNKLEGSKVLYVVVVDYYLQDRHYLGAGLQYIFLGPVFEFASVELLM